MLSARDYGRALEPLLPQAAGYARAILKSRADAEDAVQQAALKAWTAIARYDPTRPFRGWWFAILHNCCIDIVRTRKTRKTVSLEGRDLPAEPPREEEEWLRLDMAIGRLSPTHGEMLRLRYFGDLSYAEIAAALDIPLGTVMSRLHLARKALAQQMTKEPA